jgi:hypothetical protein
MKAKETFERYRDEHGWSNAKILGVVERYIDEIGRGKGLARFFWDVECEERSLGPVDFTEPAGLPGYRSEALQAAKKVAEIKLPDLDSARKNVEGRRAKPVVDGREAFVLMLLGSTEDIREIHPEEYNDLMEMLGPDARMIAAVLTNDESILREFDSEEVACANKAAEVFRAQVRHRLGTNSQG